MYKFSKDISAHLQHLDIISVHKIQEITAESCGVHCNALQSVYSEALKSSSDNNVFTHPKNTHT
jgi:hypothetical protein